jgi:signal transduction histidine kinase
MPVTSDSARAILGDAWGRIPHTHDAADGFGTFTRTRIERILTLAVGLGSLVLGLQAFLIALGAGIADEADGEFVLMLVTFASLAAMILACAVGRGVALLAGTFAIVYLLVLVTWPFTVTGDVVKPLEEPWLFFLVTVATIAAVLAFPLPVQIAWTVVTPLLFGFVRLIQGGFATSLYIPVGLDVSFALILGGTITTLCWVYRAVGTNVDEARARAVGSYAAAAAANAAEEERVAIAGLMHDSVLAALIAAERAETPRERSLAVAMAREALTRLANADSPGQEGSDAPIDLDTLADGIVQLAKDLGIDLSHPRVHGERLDVPGRVARAFQLAAGQAITNSVQHARGAGLSLRVSRHGDAGFSVVVADTGQGFDLDEIAPDRLGISGSIVARVAAVGGNAVVDSGAHGTTVTLTWDGGIR